MKRLIKATYETQGVDMEITSSASNTKYNLKGWFNDEGYVIDCTVSPLDDGVWSAKISATGDIEYTKNGKIEKVSKFKKYDSTFGDTEHYMYAIADAAAKSLDRLNKAAKLSTFGRLTHGLPLKASVDTGLTYWYLTKHGIGPGTIPGGVTMLDCIDDQWNTYILLDRMLTTEELKTYDLKEKMPPEELLPESWQHQIHGATEVDDEEYRDWLDESEDFESWDHDIDIVVPEIMKTFPGLDRKSAQTIYYWYEEEDAWEDFDSVQDFCFYLKTDIYDMLDACDSETTKKNILKQLRKDVESATVTQVDETDDTIKYVVSSTEEKPEQDIKAMSLARHKGYRILTEPNNFQGWIIMGPDRNIIKSGFLTVKQAKDWIDANLDDIASSDDTEEAEDLTEIEAASQDDRYVNWDHDLTPPDYPSSEEVGNESYVVPVTAKVIVGPDDFNDGAGWDVEEVRIDAQDVPDIDEFDVSYAGSLDDAAEDMCLSAVESLDEGVQGTFIINGQLTLDVTEYMTQVSHSRFDEDSSYFVCENIEKEIISIEPADIEGATKIEGAMTEEELDNAILEGKPFDLSDFKKYKNPIDPDAVLAENVEVGDVLDLEFDASEVNLGTVVEIIAINDPGETWVDYTFRCKVINPSKGQSLQEGDYVDLHFDTGDEVGLIVPV